MVGIGTRGGGRVGKGSCGMGSEGEGTVEWGYE